MTLSREIASPERKSRYVRRLFATIADRYDLITALFSYGQDRRWKQRLVRLADVKPGERSLDLASGTGDIAFAVADRGARVVALDITHRMLVLARAKAGPWGRPPWRPERVRTSPDWIVGDMMDLPLAPAAVDLVTTGYGIRNVPVLEGALREIHRVLRPGGRFLSLDFERPASTVKRVVYLAYLTVVGSVVGMALHGDPDTYRYIPASIRRYPGAEAVAAMLRRLGFVDVEVHRLFGGFMAIHAARKP